MAFRRHVGYWTRACFNGAATFQSRRLDPPCFRARLENRATVRFNGAATFQSRRPRGMSSRRAVHKRPASMGPRPFSRGDMSG